MLTIRIRIVLYQSHWRHLLCSPLPRVISQVKSTFYVPASSPFLFFISSSSWAQRLHSKVIKCKHCRKEKGFLWTTAIWRTNCLCKSKWWESSRSQIASTLFHLAKPLGTNIPTFISNALSRHLNSVKLDFWTPKIFSSGGKRHQRSGKGNYSNSAFRLTTT